MIHSGTFAGRRTGSAVSLIPGARSPATMRLLVLCLSLLLMLAVSGQVLAQAGNPFAGGWTLDRDASSLTFQSLKEKDGIKSETSEFASYAGEVDEAGVSTLRIQLDSVDTKVDLRNVRMRFLFFETFKFKEAVVTAILDPAVMSDLRERRRISTPVSFELDLHGVKKELNVDTVLTMIGEDRVSVASAAPVQILTADFNLDEGVAKLQDAAQVKIVPYGMVSFDLVYVHNGGGTQLASASTSAPAPAAASQAAVSEPPAPDASAAVETRGNFSDEECVGRFEILSRTGAIYFKSGSSALDSESYPLLDTVIEIINRCPSINVVVAGHTDSVGDDQLNLNLSIARAESVMGYLVANGVSRDRLTSIGYGETRPVAPNDTRRNRARNRRIEFSVTEL